MQVEGDRDRDQSSLPDGREARVQRDSEAVDVRVQFELLVARLSGVESELAALKTGMSIVESRLTGIENRQRHAEGRFERFDARYSDFSFGLDRVHSDMATLKDRVRSVELDLREMSGTLLRGSGRACGAPGPLSHTVSRAPGFKSS